MVYYLNLNSKKKNKTISSGSWSWSFFWLEPKKSTQPIINLYYPKYSNNFSSKSIKISLSSVHMMSLGLAYTYDDPKASRGPNRSVQNGNPKVKVKQNEK